MPTLNISLPDSLKGYIEKRVLDGGFSTASEFIRSLVRDDQQRNAQKDLEAALVEGMRGEFGDWSQEDVEAMKHEVRKQMKSRKSK